MGWDPFEDLKDAWHDAGDWINDEIVDPITDFVSDIPVVGDITDAAEDLWKEDVRPWTSEAMSAAGQYFGGPIGGAIGDAAGTLIEGGNSDDLRQSLVNSAINIGTQGLLGGDGQGGGGFSMEGFGDIFTNPGEFFGDIASNVGEFFTDIGTTASEFLSAPLETIQNALPSLSELTETGWEKLRAELGRLPENAMNYAMDLLQGGGDAAQQVMQGLTQGGAGTDFLNWLGSAYANERAGREREEAIRYATDAQLEAARESMDLQRDLATQSMDLQRDLAERGFGFQERGIRLGGPWREAGMGALNELSSLYGLGALDNRVDPYTGKPVSGDPLQGGRAGTPTKSREQAQQEAFGRFKTSPGYEFRLGEGTKAIDRLASARGYMGSTRAAREAQRYGEGLAAQEYDAYIGRLSNMASGGSQQVGGAVGALGGAATQASNLGTNLGTTTSALGQSLGRTTEAMGGIRASGYESGGKYGASQWADRGKLWQELF